MWFLLLGPPVVGGRRSLRETVWTLCGRSVSRCSGAKRGIHGLAKSSEAGEGQGRTCGVLKEEEEFAGKERDFTTGEMWVVMWVGGESRGGAGGCQAKKEGVI